MNGRPQFAFSIISGRGFDSRRLHFCLTSLISNVYNQISVYQKCSDGTLYTGYTGNLARRVKQHQSGAIPRSYTKSRRPVELVWAAEFETKEEARANEKKIKRWTPARKEILIREDKNQTAQIYENDGGKRNK